MSASESNTAVSRRRWSSAVAWLFLIAVYVVVVVAWTWDYSFGETGRAYDAATLTTFLVRVLGVHIGLGGAVLVVIALILRRWRYAIACLPVTIFLLWPIHDGLVGIDGPTDPSSAEVVVMSVNLRRGADGREALLRQIEQVAPDVLVLQEYTDTWHAELAKPLREAFPYSETVARPDPQGIATYSRLEFLGDERDRRLELGKWDVPALRTTIRVDDDELVVYNVHLAMPLAINAVAEQRLQVARLAALLRKEEDETIVVGDLNHTETTSHAQVLRDTGMRSAWDEVHSGRGETWRRPGRLGIVPGLRLDHVLVTTNVAVESVARGDRGESDHWPIIAGLSLPG